MRRLEFTVAVKPFGDAAKKDASKFTKELTDQDKAVTRLATKTTKLLDANRFSFKSVEEAAKKATDTISGGFERAAHVIERVNDRLKDKTKETFRSIGQQFKLAFAVFSGEHLIEKAFDLPHRLMEAGRGDINARQRARREFGADAGYMTDVAKRIGRNAGLDDSDALSALFSIGEAVSGTQTGASFRGKKLTGVQADALRKNTFTFGANLLERVLTVTKAQGDEANSIAMALANAGTGPEGMRGLVSMLHLNRAFSAQALKANEKGKLADLIGPDMARQFGVQKGKIAGQGTLVDILLTKSGITEGAAKEERSKFDFQMKSIGASFESVLGEIGSRALDRVDNGFAKGTTLAEKFQRIIESPKGKQTIEHIADSLAKGAEGAIGIATNIPKAFGWLEAHKGTIELLAGVYGGLSLYGKFKSGKGALGGVGSLISGAKPIPVYVTNMGSGGLPDGKSESSESWLKKAAKYAAPLVTGTAGAVTIPLTATAGLLYANKKLVDEPRNAIINAYNSSHPIDREAAKYFGTGYAQQHAAVIRHGGMITGNNLDDSGNEKPIEIHTHFYLDGKKVTEVVNTHNARKLKNATAGIPQ